MSVPADVCVISSSSERIHRAIFLHSLFLITISGPPLFFTSSVMVRISQSDSDRLAKTCGKRFLFDSFLFLDDALPVFPLDVLDPLHVECRYTSACDAFAKSLFGSVSSWCLDSMSLYIASQFSFILFVVSMMSNPLTFP